MSLLEILDFVLFSVFKFELCSVLISRSNRNIFIWILKLLNLRSKCLFLIISQKPNLLVILSINQHAFLSQSVKNLWLQNLDKLVKIAVNLFGTLISQKLINGRKGHSDVHGEFLERHWFWIQKVVVCIVDQLKSCFVVEFG